MGELSGVPEKRPEARSDGTSGERPSVPSFPPLGKFAILRELGRGAMGVVYEAEDTELNRKVALKLVIGPPPADPRETRPEEERFLREARLTAEMPPHRHVVRVLEAGLTDGKRYLAMELVEGLPLSEWRKRGSITIRQHVAILRDVALAVHHAHEHGIIHRDLKPENVLIDSNNEPHVTDFGLAKAVGQNPGASVTGTGLTVGTPAYMSPEQVQGRKDIDRRADVYALGVMLYEVITGRRPFHGDSAFEIMTRAVNEPVPAPSKVTRLQINPMAYKSLEDICLVALAKRRNDRQATAETFAEDLSKWLRGETVHRAPPKERRLPPFPKLLLWAAGPLAAALLLGVLGLLLRPSSRPATASNDRVLLAASIPHPAGLRPGAVLECYVGTNFNALAVRRADTRGAFDDRASPAWPGAPDQWVSFRWTGYLNVGRTGAYAFQTRSREGVRLFVDDASIIANWTRHAPYVDVTRCILEQGFHKVTLESYHAQGETLLSLAWRGGDDAEPVTLGPAAFLHDPASFAPVAPPIDPPNARAGVPGAQEGESLKVLESTGAAPEARTYDYYKSLWKGRWAGTGHLWWGSRVKPGNRLRLAFVSPASASRTLVLCLTRASDHGIFRVAVNGRTIADALDLYDPELIIHEVEFKDVELKEGDNELELTIVGTNPKAREWIPGSGLYKVGLDYLLVR